MKDDWSCLILSFHPKRVETCSLLLFVSQSMMMREFPNNRSVSRFSLEARRRVAQAPNNYALVLVPCPQLKVHLQRVFGEIYITFPAPLYIPFEGCV
jgi:hypothetical protein